MSNQSSIWNKIINVNPADSTDFNYFNRCKLSDDNSKLYTQIVHSKKALLMILNSNDGTIIGLRYKVLINSGQYGLISIISSKVQIPFFDLYQCVISFLITFLYFITLLQNYV